MKSIEKLRGLRDEAASKMVDNPKWVCKRAEEIADEIEAEIERDYMRLPVDADGVPIHVGDNLHSDETGRNFPCRGYNLTLQGSKKWWTVECCYDSYSGTSEYVSAKSCRHAKPRTPEDVLRDVRKMEQSKRDGDGTIAELFCNLIDEARDFEEKNGKSVLEWIDENEDELCELLSKVKW